MAATAARRSARSMGPGVSKGTSALAMRLLARVMRCSMALSPTRKARAICGTVRPETMRRASAICWVAGSSGWQQMKSRRRMSSRYCAPSSCSATAVSVILEIREQLLGRQRLLLLAAAELVDARCCGRRR